MQVFTIMGIDPGSRNLGISIFFIDFRTLNIVDIISIPISLNKYNILNTSRTGLINRLVYLESEAIRIIESFNPLLIAIESGFINPRMPGAVIPLASAISIIAKAAINVDPDVLIIEYPPSIIKRAIGANPIGNKSPVFNALEKNLEIVELIDIYPLTEHCVDSIAIAYTALLEIREKGIQCLF